MEEDPESGNCKIRVDLISVENVWLLEPGDNEKPKAAVSIVFPSRLQDEEYLFDSDTFAPFIAPPEQTNEETESAAKDDNKRAGKAGGDTAPPLPANYRIGVCKEFRRKADWPFLHTLTSEPMVISVHWVSPTGTRAIAGTCNVDLGPLLRLSEQPLETSCALKAPVEEDPAQGKGKVAPSKKDASKAPKKGGDVAPTLLEDAVLKLAISTSSPLLPEIDRVEAVDFGIKSFAVKNFPVKLFEFKEKSVDDPFLYHIKFEFPGFVGSWWDSVTGITKEEKLSLSYGAASDGVVELVSQGCGACGSNGENGEPTNAPTEPEPLISWKSSLKRFLPSEAVIELKKKVRRGYRFYGELLRTVKDGRPDLIDPCFMNYHCGFWLDLSPLVEEGVMEAMLCCPLQDCRTDGKPFFNQPDRQVDLKKAVPVEQIDLDQPDKNCWKDAQSFILFHVQTSQPLEPVWSPPPEPEMSIYDVIPPRPKRQNILSATQVAIEQFNHFIMVAAKTIADCHLKLVNDRKEQEQNLECLARVEQMEEMRKHLSKELHTLGAWQDIKEKLKSHVFKVASEKFKFKRQEDDKFEFCNTIYVQLMEEIQFTVADVFSERRKIDRDLPETIYTLESLKQLADEYEINDDFKSADKFHLDRLVGEGTRCPNIWFLYGSLLMRVTIADLSDETFQQQCSLQSKNKDHGKAEECFREAISLYRDHLPSLLALACLLWHREFYGHAETILRSAIALNPQEEFVLWAILARIYYSRSQRTSFLSSRRKAEVLFNEVIVYSDHTPLLSMDSARFPFSPTSFVLRNAMSNSPFVQAALSLLDLNLPKEAQELLTLEDDVFCCTVEYKLCLAIIEEQKGNFVESEIMFKQALSLEYEDEKTWCLLAHVRYSRGQYEESLQAYMKTMQYSKSGNLYEYAYVELGNIYMNLGDFEKAKHAFMKGAIIFPCSIMWLGMGIAFYKLGDMVNAEKALIEGNLLDCQNFKIWAYLTLLCIHTSRMEEAEFALDQALKNIKDASLLQEVGVAFASKKNLRFAEIALTESLKEENNLETRFHLGNVLYQQGKANDLWC